MKYTNSNEPIWYKINDTPEDAPTADAYKPIREPSKFTIKTVHIDRKLFENAPVEDMFASIPRWKKRLIDLKVRLFIIPFGRIRHYLFCIKWLYHNREWKSTRQKYKAMDKAWREAGK